MERENAGIEIWVSTEFDREENQSAEGRKEERVEFVNLRWKE